MQKGHDDCVAGLGATLSSTSHTMDYVDSIGMTHHEEVINSYMTFRQFKEVQ